MMLHIAVHADATLGSNNLHLTSVQCKLQTAARYCVACAMQHHCHLLQVDMAQLDILMYSGGNGVPQQTWWMVTCGSVDMLSDGSACLCIMPADGMQHMV